jgi:hypothetical protein
LVDTLKELGVLGHAFLLFTVQLCTQGVQLGFDLGRESLGFLVYAEIELHNLLCHVFLHLVPFFLKVDKFMLEHTRFEFHATIGHFLLILFGLSKLVLKGIAHAGESLLTFR